MVSCCPTMRLSRKPQKTPTSNPRRWLLCRPPTVSWSSRMPHNSSAMTARLPRCWPVPSHCARPRENYRAPGTSVCNGSMPAWANSGRRAALAPGSARPCPPSAWNMALLWPGPWLQRQAITSTPGPWLTRCLPTPRNTCPPRWPRASAKLSVANGHGYPRSGAHC